jgi:hypothetical protein
MNAAGWDRCVDPEPLWKFLEGQGRLNERRSRLFAAAGVRRVWRLLTDERSVPDAKFL